MNVHTSAPTDPDAFLRWNEGREGKYELVQGRVVQNMIHVTRRHARLVQELSAYLRSALRGRFEVFMVDFGMRTPDGVRYPDVVVDVPGGSGSDLAVTAPVLVAEVMSPSSIAIDMVEKLDEYKGVASLRHYLVLAQEEPRGWLWTRDAGGWTGPMMIEGHDGDVRLPDLFVEFRLGAIYAGPA